VAAWAFRVRRLSLRLPWLRCSPFFASKAKPVCGVGLHGDPAQFIETHWGRRPADCLCCGRRRLHPPGARTAFLLGTIADGGISINAGILAERAPGCS